MIIAVASGKGGTGKTTVSVSLALTAAESGPTVLLDCDAEAPDAALFLDVEYDERRDAGVRVPEVNRERCQACGRCAEVCEYGAIACFGGPPLLLTDLCHGCGSCVWACPENALTERTEVTGTLRFGRAGPLEFGEARVAVGKAMATPVIRQLKDWLLPSTKTVVIDCPPGTACSTMEAVRGADVAVLVTEPTPFGHHDLVQAVEVVRDALGIPVRVVVNRCGEGDDEVERTCEREGIPILLRIPFTRRIATALAEGYPLVTACPDYREPFFALLEDLTAERIA